LKRVIPFQNIEDWNKNADRYLASVKELPTGEVDADENGDAEKEE
jgi:hypothetical protein